MASFGETLKRERESRDISLREIAETTKINIRHLEALEADRFAALPGGVFNRGFVRAYADYLGIDADRAVNDFLAAVAALGVESNEGVLPHPERVAPGGRSRTAQQKIDPDIEDVSLQPRISMGPDPRATAGAVDPGTASDRAARRRRILTIGFWVVIGGAIVAGALTMRSDRHPATSRESSAGEAALPPPPDAEQEGFEPPDGMFVDAGPIEPGADSEGELDAGDATPSDPPATQQPPVAAKPAATKPPPVSKPATIPTRTEPKAADAAPGKTSARTTPTARQPPKSSTGVKPVQKERSLPPPVTSPSRSSPPAPPPPGPLELEVEVTRETWLWLSCDSQTRIDRRVSPGETTAMQCLRSIRVSAHDAGAIRLRVNGAACMPLGDDGDRVYGYTIRFDDAHLICRSSRSN